MKVDILIVLYIHFKLGSLLRYWNRLTIYKIVVAIIAKLFVKMRNKISHYINAVFYTASISILFKNNKVHKYLIRSTYITTLKLGSAIH